MIQYRNETKPYQTPDPLFTVVLEKVTEYKADLNNLFQELYLDIILAPADQFDAKYEAAKQKFLDAGYQEILDEKQKRLMQVNSGNHENHQNSELLPKAGLWMIWRAI